ncbi:MAG: ribonuclease Z [Deltaproteobacteria bacterium]
MRPTFLPRLIHDPFSDPGLYIPFLFERRALLFDLGDLSPLSPRDLLKVSHVFVTHTHMDHFVGFDALLRIFLGRDRDLYMYGPPHFFDRVEGKLAGYTWNLVDEYLNDLKLIVSEVRPEALLTKAYRCRERFQPIGDGEKEPFTGMLLEEPAFHVEAALLDHRVPCLGLSLVEHFYVNIDKEGLKAVELPVGPWLTRFKKALYAQQDRDTPFTVTWEREGKVTGKKDFILGDLAKKIAKISPGCKFTYITDIIGSRGNWSRVLNLARDSDHLFIEAPFLDRDKDIAKKKYHLTAKEAGALAREAGVKQFTPFHFSPRYRGHSQEIGKEAMEAFTAQKE